MPPASSTQQSNASSRPSADTEPSLETAAATYASFLSILRGIDSISPDLTLTIPGEYDVNLEANISFLRTAVDPQDEWRAQNADSFNHHRQRMQSMSRAAEILGRDDRQRRERLQRVLARLNRLHDPAYGDRVPSQNNLYDWSPGSEGEGEGEDEDEETALLIVLRDLRRQQPNTHPEVLRVLAQTQVDTERERRNRAHTSRSMNSSADSQHESSLRSAAILQAVRRHPRFSARSREYMQRYIMDRSERDAVQSDESRSSTVEESRPRVQLPQIPRGVSDGSGFHRSSSSARPRMRRALLQDPSCDNSRESPDWLGQTVTYLANLRTSYCYEDSLAQAVDAGFVTKEFFGERHNDFILDINTLPTTFETSLLAPGTVLQGEQRANPDLLKNTSALPRRWEHDWRWDSATGARRDHLPRLTLDDATRNSSSAIPPHAQRAQRTRADKYYTPESWPVKVTIHAVDYDRMTLAATMEAYDVPSHSPDHSHTNPSRPDATTNTSTHNPEYSSRFDRTDRRNSNTLNGDHGNYVNKKKSITTYLEGEILDFRTHTLLTESFKSTPENDATYWRKLTPFRNLTDEEMVRKLVSKTFMQSLAKEYILMRWKERCFVRSKESNHINPMTSSTTTSTPSSNNHNPPSAISAHTHTQTTTDNQDWYDSAEMADGCGLTISGFYYICLKRSDGSVEGLYCDPHSSPYQHLTLDRKQKFSQFLVWDFK